MNDYDQIVRRLGESQKILFVTHARPDGDGIGSGSAFTMAARAAGKEARFLVPDSVPDIYAFLPPEEPAGPQDFAKLSKWAQLIVVLDTSVSGQLNGLDFSPSDVKGITVAIDHHSTPGDIASALWVDSSAGAAGVMVAEIIQTLGWPVDAKVAQALATAILSDTGWLRFSNTDARVLQTMAKLVSLGVRPDQIYRKLYQNDRPNRIRLGGRAMSGLELFCDSRLGVMTLLRRDFEELEARPDETENLVNEALRIRSVEVAVLLVQQDGEIRVSLRSRDDVDVAQVARRFGGGGHAKAAGFRSNEDIMQVKNLLVKALTEEIAGCKRWHDDDQRISEFHP